MSDKAQIAKVRYQVAAYSGTLHVPIRSDWDNDLVIVKARRQLEREAGGYLPMGYEKFTVVERA